MSRRNLVTSLVLLFCSWAAYLATGIGTSGDSRWSLPTALSLIREGNADLNEYSALLTSNDYYAIEEIEGRYYTMFPLGASLFALPFIAGMEPALRAALDVIPGFEEFLKQRAPESTKDVSLLTFYWRIEQLIASFYAALAAVLFFHVARSRLPDGQALAAAAIFGFCTSIWSVCSTALWQHGPSAVLLTGVLLCLVSSGKAGRYLPLAGCLLTCAFVVRPTNSVPILFLSLFVLRRYPRRFPHFCLGALPFALLFAIYNFRVYGALVSPYYLPTRLGGNEAFFEALAANLVSPGRGLFVYSPVLLFAILGAFLSVREKGARGLEIALIATLLVHSMLIASFPHWWGGTTYGPRFFADLIPFMLFLMLPVFPWIRNMGQSRRRVVKAAFLLCVMISVFMHFRGASSMAPWEWNEVPVQVESDTSRIWDWTDPPFLRGLGFFEEQ